MLTGRVRLSGAATCVVAIVLGMTGCFASTPDPTPSTSAAPSAPPLFASDEEALAAATEAYTAYLAASDRILADGGLNPERLEEFASIEVAAEEEQGSSFYLESDWRLVGSSTFDSMTLQSRLTNPDGGESIVTYLCVDASGVDVVDRDGVSVVSESRPARTPLEVTFMTAADRPLIVTDKSVWTGADFCGS